MKAIEENVSKLVGKEVQNKYIILNEKLEEMDNRFVHFEEQIQILSHKCALTREECTDRINSI